MISFFLFVIFYKFKKYAYQVSPWPTSKEEKCSSSEFVFIRWITKFSRFSLITTNQKYFMQHEKQRSYHQVLKPLIPTNNVQVAQHVYLHTSEIKLNRSPVLQDHQNLGWDPEILNISCVKSVAGLQQFSMGC